MINSHKGLSILRVFFISYKGRHSQTCFLLCSIFEMEHFSFAGDFQKTSAPASHAPRLHEFAGLQGRGMKTSDDLLKGAPTSRESTLLRMVFLVLLKVISIFSYTTAPFWEYVLFFLGFLSKSELIEVSYDLLLRMGAEWDYMGHI